MSVRQRIGEAVLWLTLFVTGVINGAGIFQRISLIPDWAGDLPDSLINYFKGTTAAPDITRFWESVVPVLAVLVIATLIFNLADRPRRKWIGIGASFFFAALIATLVYFVPRGVIPLMKNAGAGLTGDEITRMARAWVFWDWFRMAVTAGCFFALLKAVTIRLTPGQARQVTSDM
jgi:hypothetical protein